MFWSVFKWKLSCTTEFWILSSIKSGVILLCWCAHSASWLGSVTNPACISSTNWIISSKLQRKIWWRRRIDLIYFCATLCWTQKPPFQGQRPNGSVDKAVQTVSAALFRCLLLFKLALQVWRILRKKSQKSL